MNLESNIAGNIIFPNSGPNSRTKPLSAAPTAPGSGNIETATYKNALMERKSINV